MKAWLATYCHDLSGRTNEAIELACTQYRQNHENRFMATSGALLHLMNERTEKVRINGRVVDGRFQPYGGLCGCTDCVEKRPRDGFYKASAEFHNEQRAERRGADEWLEYGIERLPTVLPKESLAAYRKRCGLKDSSSSGVFADRKSVTMTPELMAREEMLGAERMAKLERRLQERHN